MRPHSLLPLATGSLLLLTGCMVDLDPPGSLETMRKSLDAGKAEQVKAVLRFPVGKITVQGGGSKLMDGTFRYDRPAFKPVIEYDDSSFRGQLTIRTDRTSTNTSSTRGTHWDLTMAEKVPFEMEIHAGVGEAKLDFRRTDLRGLELHMGVGEVDIDLSGTPVRSYRAEVRGGVGEATIHLPRTVGVRVSAGGGIGGINVRGLKKDGSFYTNDLYGKSPITVQVEARGGIGAINLIAE